MTTKVEEITTSQSLLKRRDTGSTLPPDYDAANGVYELQQVTPSNSSQASLPQYEALYEDAGGSSASNAPGFYPTKHLQIQAEGFALITLPLPPRPEPICVFGVAPDGELEELEYTSIRLMRNSGNCYLVKGEDPNQTPLTTTTYRFGPGKPPKIRMRSNTLSGDLSADTEEIIVKDKGLVSRTTVMRTHLGTLEWRYASRSERKEHEADNLLVLDQVTTVALAGGKQETRRRKVAQLVRNKEFRTQGTKRCTAGNGGRLMIDLREWADRKGDAEQMEIFAVTSCITMLKKEVDRRRTHQMVVIASGAGGGP